jgi:hypothetical protein
MEQDVLSPGVQHGSETDFRSQMPGSGGNLLQGPGGGSEQDIKEDGLVTESQRIQFVRQGEDDMEVGNRQERGQSFFEPIVAGDALALGTMAIAAGMVRDALVTAGVALVQMSAEGGGAALDDVAHHLSLRGRRRIPAAILLAVRTENVGDLTGRPVVYRLVHRRSAQNVGFGSAE